MTLHRRRQRRPRLLLFAPVDGLAPSVAEIVFEEMASRAGARIGFGIAAAVAVYGALGAWAVHGPPHRLDIVSPPSELTVELFELPPPPEPSPPAMWPPRVPSRPVPMPSRTPAPAGQPSALAPAPAQAAEVVSRAAASEEPVDLTAFSIATGNAARFAGGDTSSAGTSTRAASGAVVGGQGPPTAAPTRDLSRPVGISDTEWRDCAWPQEADALGIDEQVVSMRAISRADGSFESADVLDDPGHGFGAALLACARRHGFVPALDHQGRPVRARSGTIRFTFTR